MLRKELQLFLYTVPHFQGLKCNWTNKYNHKYNFPFWYLFRILCRHEELIDITRDWVSSFVMLCQAFAAADFSCCLFVGLSSFSFVFSKWNACSIGLRSGDWLGHCRIIHFCSFKNFWVAFPLCFSRSCQAFLDVFLAKSNLARLPPGEWSSLGLKGFFFTMERILRSSTTVVLRGRPGHFMLLSSLVRSFFLRLNQTVVWPLLMFLLSLWWICLILKPNNRLFHLYGALLWLHDVDSQQQLPNANGTLRINSRPFTCLIDVERRNSPHLSMKWLLSQLSNYLLSLEKRGEVHIKEL